MDDNLKTEQIISRILWAGNLEKQPLMHSSGLPRLCSVTEPLLPTENDSCSRHPHLCTCCSVVLFIEGCGVVGGKVGSLGTPGFSPEPLNPLNPALTCCPVVSPDSWNGEDYGASSVGLKRIAPYSFSALWVFLPA